MKKVIYAFFLGIVCIASSADQDLSGRVEEVEAKGGTVYFGEQPQNIFDRSNGLQYLTKDSLWKRYIDLHKKRDELIIENKKFKQEELTDNEQVNSEIKDLYKEIKFIMNQIRSLEKTRETKKTGAKTKEEVKQLPFGRRLFSGAQKKLQRSESVNGLPSENLDVEVDRKDAAMSLPSVSFVSPQSTTEEGVTNENFNLLGQRLSQGRERLSRTASVGSIRESAAVAQDPIDENLKALLASLEHVHVKTHALFGQTLED